MFFAELELIETLKKFDTASSSVLSSERKQIAKVFSTNYQHLVKNIFDMIQTCNLYPESQFELSQLCI